MKIGVAGLAAGMTAAVMFAGCGSSAGTVSGSPAESGAPVATVTQVQTVTQPATVAGTVRHSRPRSPSPSANSSAPSSQQVYSGSGQQNLGTIDVPVDSVISWNCPDCGGTNFIINNAQSDASTIATNGLDRTDGVDPIPAGIYHTVVVDTTAGPWTVAIGRNAPPPAAPAPAAAPVPAAAPSGSQSQQVPASSSTQCDPNISVFSGTCAFAENTFYEYWAHNGAPTFAVRSPAAQADVAVTCSEGSDVTCASSDGTAVSFPQAAVDRYTQGEAAAYLQSHNPGP